MNKRVLVLLLTSWIIGCNSSTTGPSDIRPGEEFELKYGHSAGFPEAGFIVTFKALTEDSRCPEGLLCFWAGNASVVISVSEADVLLNTTLEPREAARYGYHIRLVAVDPYPRANEEHKPQDYSVKLIMTKE